MRRLALLCALLSLSVVNVPSSNAADAEREAFDEAIDRGLAYLRRNQNPDGSWSTSRRGPGDPAVTALSVMAYLSAGHVPGEGPYAQHVENGIRFVAAAQQANGSFGQRNAGHHEMYYHGICTLMLAEAIGMMPDPAEAARLRKKLERAVALTLKGQRPRGGDRGGWRYQAQGDDADISVTGWQLMSLRAAKNVGVDVPPQAIDDAVDYIQRCRDGGSGGYRYMVHGPVTVACTGTSVLSLTLCGKEHYRSAEATKAGTFLLKNPLQPDQSHFFYGIYYTSQAMFQLGDNYWRSYRQTLHRLLLSECPPGPQGGWGARGGHDDRTWGPNYCTSMAILAMTVEYRFLPIYQRGEEQAEEGASGKK